MPDAAQRLHDFVCRSAPAVPPAEAAAGGGGGGSPVAARVTTSATATSRARHCCRSACARVVIGPMPSPIHAPLSLIARWKRPFATGEPTRPPTMAAPADSPKIVTLFGSPPNAAMFALTQLQRRDAVGQRLVARRVVARLLRQLRVREEAERPEAVVEGDQDDALLREVLAVVVLARCRRLRCTRRRRSTP